MAKKNQRKGATRTVRSGLESDSQFGAVIPPIYLSSNFAFEAVGKPRQYDYSRSGNPTRDQLSAALADLEGGAGAVVTCTGLAAITLILATLPSGARVLAPHDCYGGTFRLLTGLQKRGTLRVDFIDQADPSAVQVALAARPQLVWIETPSNPLLRIVDIQALSDASRAIGAVVAVDNTFLSPIWQLPLALGADLVMHSATKYLNGHSDVIAGAVTTGAANDAWQRIKTVRTQAGAVLGPFEAWLLLRGMRTLYVRVAAQSRSAQRIAEHFSDHPKIEAILYPGLPKFPGHAVAKRQMRGGFGGMLSLRVKGGERGALAFIGRLQIWRRATSLGGVESLIEHRASIEGPQSTTPADLLRMSVGLEDVRDLILDLEQALE